MEPEDLPKMGCSEGAGDKGHEEAHVATSIHYELHRILQFASKSDEEPCGIAFNLPRVRRPNHVFDINFPMAQMIHVACRDHNAACWPVRLLGLITLVFTKNHVSALFPSENSSTAVNNHHMNSNTMTPPHFTHALPVAYLFSCFGFWRGNVLDTPLLDTRYSQSSCAERKTSDIFAIDIFAMGASATGYFRTCEHFFCLTLSGKRE